MSGNSKGMTPLQVGLIVVAAIGGVWLVWKGYIDGFTASEAPVLLVAALMTAGSLVWLQRISAARKRAANAEVDRAKGIQ